MKQPPRTRGSYIIQSKDYGLLAAVAFGCAAVTLVAFWYGLENGGIFVARTYAFVTIVIAQCIGLLVLRKTSPFSNPTLLAVLILTILLQFAVVSIPFTQDIFELR
jgi:magnesium-transporting ATPase (P-type)